MADQLALDPSVIEPGITVTIVSPDGVVLDVIDDVSLGDPLEAHAAGRESLKTAALWGYVAHKGWERAVRAQRRTEGTPEDAPLPALHPSTLDRDFADEIAAWREAHPC